MDSTGFCLPCNWSIEEWPDVIAVTHEGTCEGLRVYVPERTCKVEWKHIGGDVAAAYCECGTELDKCHDYEPAHLPNYCPNCGVKVME